MSCSACGAVAHAGAFRCPECGHAYGGALQVAAGLMTPVSDPDRTLTGGPLSMVESETGSGETPFDSQIATGAGDTPTGAGAGETPTGTPGPEAGTTKL